MIIIILFFVSLFALSFFVFCFCSFRPENKKERRIRRLRKIAQLEWKLKQSPPFWEDGLWMGEVDYVPEPDKWQKALCLICNKEQYFLSNHDLGELGICYDCLKTRKDVKEFYRPPEVINPGPKAGGAADLYKIDWTQEHLKNTYPGQVVADTSISRPYVNMSNKVALPKVVGGTTLSIDVRISDQENITDDEKWKSIVGAFNRPFKLEKSARGTILTTDTGEQFVL